VEKSVIAQMDDAIAAQQENDLLLKIRRVSLKIRDLEKSIKDDKQQRNESKNSSSSSNNKATTSASVGEKKSASMRRLEMLQDKVG